MLPLLNIDWTPFTKSLPPWGKVIKQLFTEHHFLTIICAFFIVMMCLSFYRILRSISPALVGFILLLMLGILVLHWAETRTEPPFLTPFIDWISMWLPTPSYQGVPVKPPVPPPHH